MKRLVCLIFGIGLHAFGSTTFYTTQSSFNTATSALFSLTSENWSSGIGAPATLYQLNDPIQPGVANLINGNGFPTGSAAGIQVQSNTNTTGATISPRGTDGLVFGTTGALGNSGNPQPTNQVSVQLNPDTFDILLSAISGHQPMAISLSPMFYQISGASSGTVTIRVYSSTNTLLGSTSVSGIADVSESAFIGIRVDPGDAPLYRINLATDANSVVGADNLVVLSDTTGSQAVPEPGTIALFTVGGIVVAVWRQRSRPSLG